MVVRDSALTGPLSTLPTRRPETPLRRVTDRPMTSPPGSTTDARYQRVVGDDPGLTETGIDPPSQGRREPVVVGALVVALG